MNNQPIGILDSGVGGLSIWKEIVKELPYESTIYLADSINCPYGDRTEAEIYILAKRLVKFIIQNKAKLIVIACNTITVACIDKLREEFKGIPIVGTVPPIKTAARYSNNKKIGILSTLTTSQSIYQKRLIDTFAKNCEVVNISASEVVPFVERGEVEGKEVKELTEMLLREFLAKDVDAIALGCSHFPFLREEIEKIVGSKVKILDSGNAIARQARRVLTNNNSLSLSKNTLHEFYTTGNAEEFVKVSKKLVGDKFRRLIKEVQAVSL
ncbi:MAG: glutamate racemase [Patescibacteria group bacterium]